MSEELPEKKIALVTGVSRGIGAAIALKLGSLEEVTVIGTATTESGAEKISALFKQKNINGYGAVLELTNNESINKLFNDLESASHLPNILVNNAGIAQDNLVLRMKDEEWEQVLNTNLTAVFKMSKRAVKSMLKQRWGRIINISSVSGCLGIAGQANYAASKAGVIGFSKALAKEVAARGITVNIIAPGFIKSDMTDALPQEYQEKILNEIPMKRQGEAKDIAAAVAYLASEEAGYITGATLHINGGLYM